MRTILKTAEYAVSGLDYAQDRIEDLIKETDRGDLSVEEAGCQLSVILDHVATNQDFAREVAERIQKMTARLGHIAESVDRLCSELEGTDTLIDDENIEELILDPLCWVKEKINRCRWELGVKGLE